MAEQLNFPNGFESWHETHFEMVSHLCEMADIENSMSWARREEQGIGGLYLLAKELTDEFEEKYTGTAWGEELEYFDEIEAFLKEKEVGKG